MAGHYRIALFLQTDPLFTALDIRHSKRQKDFLSFNKYQKNCFIVKICTHIEKIQSSPVAAPPQDSAGEQCSPLISDFCQAPGGWQEAARLYQQALVSSQPGGRDVGGSLCCCPHPTSTIAATLSRGFTKPQPESTLVQCPAPDLFTIHGVSLGLVQSCVTHRHCRGHRAGPRESSQPRKRHRPLPALPQRAGDKAQLHRRVYPPSSSNRAAMAFWGARLHGEGVTTPRSSASTRHCSVGWVQKWLCPGATLLRMARV